MRVSLFFRFFWCFVFAVSGFVQAESQGDWSGGASEAGPVEYWGDSFASADGLSWLAIPGQLALSSTVVEAPEKKFLDRGFGAAYGLYAFDVDLDLDTDLVGTTDSDGGVYIWLNSGGDPGDWERLTVDADYPGGTSVHPIDLDKDGDIDIVGAAQTPGHNVAWWRNDGGDPIIWTRQIIDDFVLVACNVFAADVDGDDDVDVLSTSWSQGILSWWSNDGGDPIVWTKHEIARAFNGAHSAFADDIDGDGDTDVVATAANNHDVVLFLNDGLDPISWTEVVLGDDMVGVRYATMADIDSDGLLDIAAAGFDGKVPWWRNLGDGTWARQTIDTECHGGHYIIVADLNGDAKQDVLVAAYEVDSILWFENGGGREPQWTRHVISDSLQAPLTAFPADINGDGALEVVGAIYGGGNFSWWDISDFVSNGELVSSVIDAGSDSEFSSISWVADVPEDTALTIEIRASSNEYDLGEWSAAFESPYQFSWPAGRYFQYRVLMESNNPDASPVLKQVRVSNTVVAGQTEIEEHIAE